LRLLASIARTQDLGSAWEAAGRSAALLDPLLDQILAPAASRCHVSRHLLGRLFFDQKMPAVTSGGMCSSHGTITGFLAPAGMKILQLS
jgi:hypothetical protein